jgi:MFS family permease
MSEIAPRKVRGALVSGYQFCITIGLLLASVVDYATKDRTDSGSYRIPIGIQFAWAIILAVGLFLLPESPRYFVKKGNVPAATKVLARLRGHPAESEYIQAEVAEIIACVSRVAERASLTARAQQPRVRVERHARGRLLPILDQLLHRIACAPRLGVLALPDLWQSGTPHPTSAAPSSAPRSR